MTVQNNWLFVDNEGITEYDLVAVKAAGIKLGTAYALLFNDPEKTADLIADAATEYGPATNAVILAALQALAEFSNAAIDLMEDFGSPMRQRFENMAAGLPADPALDEWDPKPAARAVFGNRARPTRNREMRRR